MSEALHYELKNSIAWIRMDDGKLNLLGSPLMRGLQELLGRAAAEASAAVLIGRPGAFSAGLNLKEVRELRGAQLVEFQKLFSTTVFRLFTFPKPLVAAVSGHAIAGGAIFAMACDRRLAARGAFKLGLNEVPIGVSFPHFILDMARSVYTPQYLERAVLHGELTDPDTAREWGLIHEVTAAEELEAAAARQAEELAKLPHEPYWRAKEYLRRKTFGREFSAVLAEFESFAFFQSSH
ncbi:MAG: Carnitinyl-CoA dehydratase [Myxococcota bacterium]|nr:Carnitinyl-CoA dehydratase [Myxococcota bacterium]